MAVAAAARRGTVVRASTAYRRRRGYVAWFERRRRSARRRQCAPPSSQAAQRQPLRFSFFRRVVVVTTQQQQRRRRRDGGEARRQRSATGVVLGCVVVACNTNSFGSCAWYKVTWRTDWRTDGRTTSGKKLPAHIVEFVVFMHASLVVSYLPLLVFPKGVAPTSHPHCLVPEYCLPSPWCRAAATSFLRVGTLMLFWVS